MVRFRSSSLLRRFHNSPLAELRNSAQQEMLVVEDRLKMCLHSRAGGCIQAIATQRTGMFQCSFITRLCTLYGSKVFLGL